MKARAQHTHKSKAVPPRLTPGSLAFGARKRCIAKARSGERCQSAPMRGKKKCMFHTGNYASTLGSKGGHRRAIFSPEGLMPFDAPQSAADLQALLGQSIVEVRGGKLDTKVANAIACLATGFFRAIEVSDLEARVAALEKGGAEDE